MKYCIKAGFGLLIASFIWLLPKQILDKSPRTACLIAAENSPPAIHFAGESMPIEDLKVYKRLVKNVRKQESAQYISYITRGAARWFPVIEPILAKHGIPEDFKYMPAIESEFKKTAKSPKGAFGFWQFMPATARGYGLIVSDTVDQRADVLKSTEAACRYLKDLHNLLGSWTAVAAAYNFGGGALTRSMRKQKENDYYRLALNPETGNYVYKMVALKQLLTHADSALLVIEASLQASSGAFVITPKSS